jgi:hypothetical protein
MRDERRLDVRTLDEHMLGGHKPDARRLDACKRPWQDNNVRDSHRRLFSLVNDRLDK